MAPEHRLDGVAPGFFADIVNSRHSLGSNNVNIGDILTVTSAPGKRFIGSNGVERISFANYIRNGDGVGGSGATPPTNWTAGFTSAGITVTPIGPAVVNGISGYIYQFAGTASSSTGLAVATESNNTISSSIGQVWTSSLHVQLVSGSLAGVNSTSLCVEGLNAGVRTEIQRTLNNLSGISSTLNRYAQTVTLNGATTTVSRSLFEIVFTIAATINFQVFLGGSQHEPNSYASPYIPTKGLAASTPRIDYSYGVGELQLVGAYTQEVWPSRHSLGTWQRNEISVDNAQTMISISGDSIPKYVPTVATGLKFCSPRNVGSTMTYNVGTAYTFSIDIISPKTDGGSGNIILETPNGTAFDAATWGNTAQNTINIRNGTYSGGFAGVNIRRIGSMFRVTKTVVASGTISSAAFPQVYWNIYGPSTGDGVSGFFIDRSLVHIGSAELPYVESISAPVTVTGDTCTLTTAAYNVLAGTSGAVAARGVYPVTAIASSRLVAYGGFHIVGPRTGNLTQAENFNGTTAVYASAASGNWPTGFGAVGSWNAGNRSIVLNGGTVTNDANGRGAQTVITIGPQTGMQAGQFIRLRQLVGWNLADIGTNAQLQAQARLA